MRSPSAPQSASRTRSARSRGAVLPSGSRPSVPMSWPEESRESRWIASSPREDTPSSTAPSSPSDSDSGLPDGTENSSGGRPRQWAL